MDKHELLARYELRGDECDYLAAKPLYEQTLAQREDPRLLLEYGYLLECHARNQLRQAVDRYRRAVELDPAADKARYQLIRTLAALFDTDEMIDLYRQRVSAAPGELREYRFLAAASLAAGRAEQALATIAAGLALDPEDRSLIAQRGQARATADDPEGALADWRRAIQLDDSDIGPLYQSAYLLEREGRLDEAIQTWQAVLRWTRDRGSMLEAELPRRELRRLRHASPATPGGSGSAAGA
ncbi:MAG: hypothetical protein ACYDCH_07665 [Gaiellaceae bacterium]